MTITYIFDGTLNGILTAIFESFERKHKAVKLVSREHFMQGMFGEELNIIADKVKAARVWKGLGQKANTNILHLFYAAFLSEDPVIFQHLFNYALYIFDNTIGHATNYGNEHVLAIAQIAKKVHREKHRMEAFIRFQKSNDGLFFAIVNPDYNVLPLIITHFRNRYADQVWVIYDERRKYGIWYDQQQVCEVTFNFIAKGASPQALAPVSLDEQEVLYTTLWKDYFKSTNIVERKNMKLHIQHVPKRYWRYLTEKELPL